MHLVRTLAFAVLGAASPSQQLVFGVNDNLSYGAYVVGSQNISIAFRFTPTRAITLAAAEVFTGNQAPAPHTLEIRTRNPTTGLPDQTVGLPGTWWTTHARCWQGAQFAQPAALQAGDYFLVWSPGGVLPQYSVSAGNHPGNVLDEVHFFDGSTWYEQNYAAVKFRLFTPYAAGTTTTFGTAKPGIYGNPTIGLNGWPAVGSPIDVWLDNAARVASSAPPNAVLLIGWPIPSGLVFPFATVYVTGEILVLQRTDLHTSPTSGATSYTLFAPNSPLAIGQRVSFQWAVFDPAAADGLAHTSAVTALIQ